MVAPCIAITLKTGSKGVRNALFFSGLLLFWKSAQQTFCYNPWARTKSWLFVSVTEAEKMSFSWGSQDLAQGLGSSPKTKSVRKEQERAIFTIPRRMYPPSGVPRGIPQNRRVRRTERKKKDTDPSVSRYVRQPYHSLP